MPRSTTKKRVFVVGYARYNVPDSVSEQDIMTAIDVLSKLEECNFDGSLTEPVKKLSLEYTVSISTTED